MHLHRILLLTVCILSATMMICQITFSSLAADRNGARFLRVGKAISTGDDAEERGVLSCLSSIDKNAKVRGWLETGKSEEYVKTALKLDGLEGQALTSHKNYKYFQKFVYKAEGYRLNEWYLDKFTTHHVWEKVGLGNIRTLEQLEPIMHTDKFRVYKRYVNEFDDNVYRAMVNREPPHVEMLSFGASEAEITARIYIMAEARRSDEYAKVALGLTQPGKPMTVLPGKYLESHSNIEHYKFFKLVQEKVFQANKKQERSGGGKEVPYLVWLKCRVST